MHASDERGTGSDGIGWNVLDRSTEITGGWRTIPRRFTGSLRACEGRTSRRGNTARRLVSDQTALRGFCARILGWSPEQTATIEQALRSIRLGATGRAALVLVGDTSLVTVAHALHRRALGLDRPFVVCDPRRTNTRTSARAPTNYATGVAAARAATGGSLCLYQARMPADLAAMAALVRDAESSIQLIICAEARRDLHPFLLRPAPIRVPSLRTRASELARIVDEYALDAIEDLFAGATGFSHADRDWVIAHSASSLAAIEKGTRRLVAIRQAGSVTQAAVRLGMSHVALAQWFARRGLGRRSKATDGHRQQLGHDALGQ